MPKHFTARRAIKKRKSLLKNSFFWVFLAALGVCGIMLYGIVAFPFFQVQALHVQGNKEVAADTIEQEVWRKVESRFGFFATKNILLVNTAAMQDSVLAAIPELESVVVEKDFPRALTVRIREKRQVATWCTGGTCFSVDKEGIAFKQAERSSVLSLASATEVAIPAAGQRVAEKEMVESIMRFQERIEATAVFEKHAITLPLFTVVSAEQLLAATSEGWKIYVNPAENAQWQVTKLQTVLERKVPEEKRTRLEYIDLRFGDQAYIKYR